jgi:hypothetical protein
LGAAPIVESTGRRQVRSELGLGRRSATLVLAAQLDQVTEAVLSLGHDPAVQRAARDGARLQGVLDREASTDLLLAVTGRDGRLLAQAGRTQPSFLPGVAVPGSLALLGPARPARAWRCCSAAPSPSTGPPAPGGGSSRARSAR